MARYTPTVAAMICDRLARGESLSAICGSDRAAALPSQSTVYRWLKERPRFARQFATSVGRFA